MMAPSFRCRWRCADAPRLLQDSLTVLARQKSNPIWVAIAAVSHLFPFRTEQLSPPAPMVLQCNAGEQVAALFLHIGSRFLMRGAGTPSFVCLSRTPASSPASPAPHPLLFSHRPFSLSLPSPSSPCMSLSSFSSRPRHDGGVGCGQQSFPLTREGQEGFITPKSRKNTTACQMSITPHYKRGTSSRTRVCLCGTPAVQSLFSVRET